jgi:hypothetical protein
MSKAFDRVRHDVLLDKLQNINIRGNLHSWFSSYLSGRKQRVPVPGGTSSSLAVTSDVPQGSILGPVLFLLYVKDTVQSVCKHRLCLHFGMQNIEFYSTTIYIFMILEYNKLLRDNNQALQDHKMK